MPRSPVSAIPPFPIDGATNTPAAWLAAARASLSPHLLHALEQHAFEGVDQRCASPLNSLSRVPRFNNLTGNDLTPSVACATGLAGRRAG